MNNDSDKPALDRPANIERHYTLIVLRILSLIGAVFLIVAGGYMHGARADSNSGRSGERGHTAAQERSHYGPAEERHRTGEREERGRVDTAESRNRVETTGEREYTGAGSRHRVP